MTLSTSSSVLFIIFATFIISVNAEDSAHQTLSSSLLVIAVSLFCSLAIVFCLSKYKVLIVPSSVFTILIGVLVGVVAHYGFQTKSVTAFAFHPETFYLCMLPPIIFDAGFTLHKGYFFRNIVSILVLAIFGTLISAFIIGLGLYAFGSPPEMTLIHTLMFGALISAIDPVATLAIFHSLDVNHTLHMLVFGESVLNDAVSIVMYRTLESINVSSASIFYAISQFFLIITASILIGIIFALISSSIFRYSHVKEYPTIEMCLFFSLLYFPYLVSEIYMCADWQISEILGMSGIISLLFYGILTSHYSYFSLSTSSQFIVTNFFHVLAFVSETIVFLYLGFSVFIYHQKFNVAFTFMAIIWCLVGRAANVFPLSFVLNHVHSTLSVDISMKNQIVLWFSGLRGAIAFVLCLDFPVANAEVVTTTLIIVLVSVCILGGGTVPLLKILSVEGAHNPAVIEQETLEFSERAGIYHKITEFDKHNLIPLFRRKTIKNLSSIQISHELRTKLDEYYHLEEEHKETEAGKGEVMTTQEEKQVAMSKSVDFADSLVNSIDVPPTEDVE